METPAISNEPKPKISKFALLWIVLIVFCLLGFLVSMGLMAWGFYSITQDMNEKSKIPYATATAVMQWPVVFSDDFGALTDHWYTGDYTENGRRDARSISNGVYTWTLENATGYTYWHPAEAGVFRDFVLSTDVRHMSGTEYDEYGLIFCNVTGNYYVFAIQDAGYYSVVVWSAGNWNQIIPHSRSNAIKPGEYNHLMVMAESGSFKLFINNEFVQEFQDKTLPSGDVGLMLAPQNQTNSQPSKPNGVSRTNVDLQSVVEFDNFEVRAPKSSETDQKLSPQLPQIAPDNGRLVFASNRDGNRNIYSVFTSGNGIKQLTDDPAADYAPRWSPDGEKIVFVSNRDGNSEIYIMDADGKNQTRLTDNPSDDISPDWSPDGKQIIFSSKREGNYEIYLMSAQGEKASLNQLTKTKYDEINPSISPDGAKILFQVKERTAYSLSIMGIDGKQVKRVTYSDPDITYNDGAWAPDNSHFAYVIKYGGIRGEIWVGDIHQTPDFLAGNQLTGEQSMNLYPGWAPSGKQLVFVSDRDGQADIYIMLAGGDGIFRVTHNEAVEESPDWIAP
jgi:TolB protein